MRLATPAALLLTLALAGSQIVANLILRLLERMGLPRETVLALVQLPAIARARTGKAGAPALSRSASPTLQRQPTSRNIATPAPRRPGGRRLGPWLGQLLAVALQ